MKKPAKKIKKFTVVRKRWARGVNSGPLYSQDSQNMCCLGFLARECGANIRDGSKNSIRNLGFIYEAPHVAWPQKLKPVTKTDGEGAYLADSDLASKIIDVNDDDSIGDAKRERELKKLFEKADVEIVFE